MVLAGAGPFTNEYEAVLAGHSFDGMPRITYLELPQLWIHPRCMKIIATLLALKLRASGTSDERCHKDFQPLFSQ
jgi:hypothetical protein